MTRSLPHVLLALAALALAACAADPTRGYSFTPAHDASVRSIAVPVFNNRTFTTPLEVELTDAVIKEIRRSTPWTIVADAAADTTLTGTITAHRMRTLSRARTTGLVQEVGVEITIDFDWRDNRSGELLLSKRSFSALDTFVPARGTAERLETGQLGATEALARAIVAELRSNW